MMNKKSQSFYFTLTVVVCLLLYIWAFRREREKNTEMKIQLIESGKKIDSLNYIININDSVHKKNDTNKQ